MVLAVIVLIVGAAVLVAGLWFMIFGERQAVRPGIVSGISRFIPLQAIKITIVAWQILTQVSPCFFHPGGTSIGMELG